MKKYLLIALAIMCLISAPNVCRADELDDVIKEKSIILNFCSDPKIGYRIKCNPDWIMSDEPNSVSIIIVDAAELQVTATISNSDEQGVSLNVLTPEKLRLMGQYGEEIRMDRVKIGGADALQVKAFAQDLPDMQLLDYYAVKDKRLYTIFFAVNPAEKFDDFKELFETMIHSFEFLAR